MEAYAGQALHVHPGSKMEAMRREIILYIAVVFGIISCSKEPVEVVYTDLGERRGVFISCEGNFMYGNASLSFYDKERKEVFNQVFFARNRAPLGDVAQSLNSDGKNLFIVVNNSGKVMVVDLKTLEFKGVIPGLVSPRYIHFLRSDKAYISDLYNPNITVFNPLTLEKTGIIRVSDGKQGSMKHPTEMFAESGGRIFVTCWANDNQILVIDPVYDQVLDSISVPMQPRRIVADMYGKLWVLTDGSYPGAPGGEEQSSLVRIDPQTLTIEQIMRWNTGREFAGDLKLNPSKDTLYILAGDLYKMAVTSRRLPESPFIESTDYLFFSLGVDPGNGDFYLADAIDYQQNAMVYRFSRGGMPLDSFRVGINPGDFYFN